MCSEDLHRYFRDNWERCTPSQLHRQPFVIQCETFRICSLPFLRPLPSYGAQRDLWNRWYFDREILYGIMQNWLRARTSRRPAHYRRRQASTKPRASARTSKPHGNWGKVKAIVTRRLYDKPCMEGWRVDDEQQSHESTAKLATKTMCSGTDKHESMLEIRARVMFHEILSR